ncbi:hypothetical protein MNBD_NITROSPINAE02-574, partial [hydrothermal vent metagenome]
TLPFSLRYWMGFMTDDLPGLAFIAMIFFAVFALSSFYSLLLPRFIDLSPNGTDSLARLYGLELMGAVAGLSAVYFFGSIPWIQPILYQGALAILMALLFGGRVVWALSLAALLLYASLFTALDHHSLAYHYNKFHKLKESKILYSVNSPYQKVDIVKSGTGRRYIFLDGKKNYGTTSLRIFNVYLSRSPAKLVMPKNALIIGAGSMESLHHVAQVSEMVDVVEIDKAMPDGSKIYFADVNHIGRYDNWKLTIEDAKSYLNNTDTLYDLIVVDIPAPLTVQTGLLHSVEFYKMAKKRLSPQGVISVSLSGKFGRANKTPRTVAAALARAFEEMVIYTPDIARRSFAIAGRSLPFSMSELIATSTSMGATTTAVFNKKEALEIIDGIAPITFDNLSHPLKRSVRRVGRKYFR